MRKLLLSILLILTLSDSLFASHWRWRNRYPRRYNYNYNYNTRNRSQNFNSISPGAATAIGLGVGVLGFAIGRASKKNEKEIVYRDSPSISCKEFPIKVNIDGEEKTAKITKCKTQDGEWKIPE